MIRSKKYIILTVLLIGFFAYILINNNIIVKGNIYYSINYDINLPQEQELIDRVETFNLSAHISIRKQGCWFEDYYFNRLKINSHIQSIKSDNSFHISPFYQHSFEYHFKAQKYSSILINYTNCGILSSNYSGDFFLVEYSTGFYLNDSFLSPVPIQNSSIEVTLNNVIIVKTTISSSQIDDFQYCVTGQEYIQYIILDYDFQIVLVHVPLVLFYP